MSAKQSPPIVIIWLDCVAGDLFREMYENGRLPNLYEYFSQGAYIRKMVTTFPTVTESAEGAVISGHLAGETNMLGERLFSRKEHEIIHYKFNARTIEDFNPGLRQAIIDRAAQPSIAMGRTIASADRNIVDLKAAKYERTGSPELVRRRIEVASTLALAEKPRLLFFSISFDYISHVYGRRNQQAEKMLQEFDKQFPQLIAALNQAYGKNQYLITVFSDHGSANVCKHLDLTKLLQEHDLAPAPTDLLAPAESATSAALSNGRRSGVIYLRHPSEGWRKSPGYRLLRNYPHKGRRIDLVKLLAEEPGVKHVYAKKDANTVLVASQEGEAEIQRDPEDRLRYRVVKGNDPLGYGEETEWLTEEEWLKASYDSEYPDAAVQIPLLFKSKLAGDIFLNAAPGWDFWEPWDIPYPRLRASHGGLTREEMVTFLLIRGPGIKQATIEYGRITDLYATLARYLDLPPTSHGTERLLP